MLHAVGRQEAGLTPTAPLLSLITALFHAPFSRTHARTHARTLVGDVGRQEAFPRYYHYHYNNNNNNTPLKALWGRQEAVLRERAGSRRLASTSRWLAQSASVD